MSLKNITEAVNPEHNKRLRKYLKGKKFVVDGMVYEFAGARKWPKDDMIDVIFDVSCEHGKGECDVCAEKWDESDKRFRLKMKALIGTLIPGKTGLLLRHKGGLAYASMMLNWGKVKINEAVDPKGALQTKLNAIDKYLSRYRTKPLISSFPYDSHIVDHAAVFHFSRINKDAPPFLTLDLKFEGSKSGVRERVYKDLHMYFGISKGDMQIHMYDAGYEEEAEMFQENKQFRYRKPGQPEEMLPSGAQDQSGI